MKRPPADGEPVLIHRIVETGREERIAISDDNFNPLLIRYLSSTLPLIDTKMGLSIVEIDGGFELHHHERRVTINELERTDDGLVLITSLARMDSRIVTGPDALSAEDIAMCADCEQCVAIALAWRKE